MKNSLFALLGLIILLSSCSEDPKDVQLNFKLKYDGEPLVMLDEYVYPDGRPIKFTRVSFYLSDVQAIDDGQSQEILDVAMINLAESHATMGGANDGYTLLIEDQDIENLDAIRMNIGLTSEQNGKAPNDYDIDNPLSNTGEYWIGWESYIFAKIEGLIDMDRDGTTEKTFALHLGSDEIMRTITFDNINMNESDQYDLNFEIDVKNIFENGAVYDIETTPNIHSLNQINQANQLIDNWAQAFSIRIEQ